MSRSFLHRLKIKVSAWLGPKPLARIGIDEVGTSNGYNRDQWVIAQLQQLPSGLRLLDAGAGEQPYKKYCGHLTYVSQDFAQYNPENVPQGLQMKTWDYGTLDIVSDVANIPEPDASFDAVLCTEVIEHMVNPMEAIQEFHRLLKPGGHLLLTAPFCSMTHFAPYHFYSGFNRFFYETVLGKQGFDILSMEENGNYFEFVSQELRRLDSIGIQYAEAQQSPEVRRAMDVLQEYLYQCAANDKGSKELLFFGLHVKAVKKNSPAL